MEPTDQTMMTTIRLKTDDEGKRTPALGQKVTKFEGFDTFQRPTHTNRVTLVSDEVTALCPVTDQPDWYTVTIAYSPKNKCLESKSFKLYLHSLRNVGMFVEALATKIANDIFEALLPDWIEVDIIQKARGGVEITASASRYITEEERKKQ